MSRGKLSTETFDTKNKRYKIDIYETRYDEKFNRIFSKKR